MSSVYEGNFQIEKRTRRQNMKLRSKIWAGIGIVLIVSLTLFIIGNQNNKPEEEKTISNDQTESKQERPDGEMETTENGHEGDTVSENNGYEQTEADKKQEQHAQTEADRIKNK